MAEASAPQAGPSRLRSLALSFALLATVCFASMLVPIKSMAVQRQFADLNTEIPKQLGAWTMENQALIPLVSADLQAGLQRIYSQTVNRIYVNGDGERIMLAVAYGGDQLGNELQVHRPEYCYKAQGFELMNLRDGHVFTGSGELPVRRLVARQGGRIEPITYWMTVGNETVLPGLARKLAQLRYGLKGQIADGMLIRVSSLGSDTEKAFRLHEVFISDLKQGLPENLAFIAARPASALDAMPLLN